MNSTKSPAPKLEFGPRLAVDREYRGCKGCKHFNKNAFPESAHFGKCMATLNLPELPFWLHIDGTDNVADYQGFSCALWENANAKDEGRKEGAHKVRQSAADSWNSRSDQRSVIDK